MPRECFNLSRECFRLLYMCMAVWRSEVVAPRNAIQLRGLGVFFGICSPVAAPIDVAGGAGISCGTIMAAGD